MSYSICEINHPSSTFYQLSAEKPQQAMEYKSLPRRARHTLYTGKEAIEARAVEMKVMSFDQNCAQPAFVSITHQKIDEIDILRTLTVNLKNSLKDMRAIADKAEATVKSNADFIAQLEKVTEYSAIFFNLSVGNKVIA